ncbi:hypothetical protein [Cetobacterium sp.]|uniref:hypothetical protein n=1 Tax=Cetobacterium sp. TaxID=2071632 RepID=UPI002FCB6569
MKKDLKWDYQKFKEFDKFIRGFEIYEDLLVFLEKNIINLDENQEFFDYIIKLSPQEQLLLFYLKQNRLNDPPLNFYKEYLIFCQEYHKIFSEDLFEVDSWKKKAIYYINRKNKFIVSLKVTKNRLKKLKNNYLN